MRRDIAVEVNGKQFSVSMWVPDQASNPNGRTKRAPRKKSGGGGAAGSGQIEVPMQGTIIKVEVSEGDTVEAGQVLCVLEAMKMENNITTDVAGTVRELKVVAGDSVGGGDVVAVIG